MNWIPFLVSFIEWRDFTMALLWAVVLASSSLLELGKVDDSEQTAESCNQGE